MTTIWGTLSLGELIDLLKRRDPAEQVRFDFGDLCVAYIGSYRGFYDHLAIGFDEFHKSQHQTVADVLKLLEDANGQTFTGYKGGHFKMNLDTPVWVSNYGEASATAIVGLCDCEHTATLKTGWGNV